MSVNYRISARTWIEMSEPAEPPWGLFASFAESIGLSVRRVDEEDGVLYFEARGFEDNIIFDHFGLGWRAGALDASVEVALAHWLLKMFTDLEFWMFSGDGDVAFRFDASDVGEKLALVQTGESVRFDPGDDVPAALLPNDSTQGARRSISGKNLWTFASLTVAEVTVSGLATLRDIPFRRRGWRRLQDGGG